MNIVETGLYFNLLALSAFSWYDFKADITQQRAVAHISAIITFILLVGVIIYHVYSLVRKDQPPPEVADYPLAQVQATITHTSVVISNRFDQSQANRPIN